LGLRAANPEFRGNARHRDRFPWPACASASVPCIALSRGYRFAHTEARVGGEPKPVAIIMGSQSDWAVMRRAAGTLEALGVGYDARIVSAHRRGLR
jgi:hypothetical protein